MLVSREELRYDFKNAQFNLKQEADRKLLGWIFNQFLYGEVTGIQCGHWLYRAPNLNAASFLAKQASEELSHVKKILRVLTLLGEEPAPVHWAIRFLTTGMMGSSWGEHVVLEMALGEGLVLGVFYAMMDTIPDSDIHKILSQAALEEEKHVEFGEKEAQAWLVLHPGSRPFLLSLAWIQIWVLQRLKRYVIAQLTRELNRADHPVLGQFEAFYDHTLRHFELRVERLGLAKTPLRKFKLKDKIKLFAPFLWRFLKEKFSTRAPLLTTIYLKDPVLVAERKRALPSSKEIESSQMPSEKRYDF